MPQRSRTCPGLLRAQGAECAPAVANSRLPADAERLKTGPPYVGERSRPTRPLIFQRLSIPYSRAHDRAIRHYSHIDIYIYIRWARPG